MTSITVVENFNVFKNIQSGLISGGVVPIKDQLDFESSEKTFHRGVVKTITFAAHTTDHLILCQQSLIFIAGVLAASV
jgi:hypothetical protein